VPRSSRLPELVYPVVQAPLAGGPSTPELAAAVSGVGAFGFLAAGYKTPDAVRADIARLRELTDAPFGVNLFLLHQPAVEREVVEAYAQELQAEVVPYNVELGEPRYEDDAFEEKLALVLAERPSVVSFTFGCPTAAVVERLHGRDIAVLVTVTDVDEALQAAACGADALVVQGFEAGGHRGSFEDRDEHGMVALLPLLRLVARAVDLPLVASGGIADGAAIAAVLAAGAWAAQIGTAFMLTPEAATSRPHGAALGRPGRTALTRAFTGRRARGIVNRFMARHEDAPSAYPHIHHLTAPLRAAARAAGDAETINLWAGQAYPLAEALPAAELVRRWGDEAAAALDAARRTLPPS
jgi:nitronate monooxygenase